LRLSRLVVCGSLALLGSCAGKAPPAVAPVPYAAPAETELTLFLIGDGGRPAEGGDPVLEALAAQIETAPGPAAVVFLGDNVYDDGLPLPGASDREEMERRLLDQMRAVLRTKAGAIFVPGNHDWDNGGDDGSNAIRRQDDFIRENGDGGRIRLLPVKGCPGPSVEKLSDRVVLVALDTQWWLHGHDKPGASDCEPGTEDAVQAKLSEALSDRSRTAIVVAHHPLLSSGPHGGYFNWQDHLFPLTRAWSPLWIPLPGVGSLYPLARVLGATSQDQRNPKNAHMRAALEESFRSAPPLVYAAGHEHTLEVLAGDVVPFLLVSGTGYYDHTSPTKTRPRTKYRNEAGGFMRLDFSRSGAVRLGVFTVRGDSSVDEPYSEWIVEGR
jgi:hypothetical protein